LLLAIAAAALIVAVLALFSIIILADGWVVLVIIEAIAVALQYILYFGFFVLLPLAIDAMLLWGVFVQH